MTANEYCLIGRKLGHSFSADFFNEKFRREGISSHYSLVELEDFNDLEGYLRDHPNVRGMNVTIPYKENAAHRCDRLTPEASAIGAVNTIKVERDADGRVSLFGTNTDAPGFAAAVADGASGIEHALVLGTGGASKAVCFALKSMGIEPCRVSRVSREGCITYGDLSPEVMERHRLVVNTTPLGMMPDTDTFPDIPYHLLTEAHYCFDLVYNPSVTMFMRLAAEHGARVDNGLQMLVNQALLAWEFWQK